MIGHKLNQTMKLISLMHETIFRKSTKPTSLRHRNPPGKDSFYNLLQNKYSEPHLNPIPDPVPEPIQIRLDTHMMRKSGIRTRIHKGTIGKGDPQ